MQKLGIKIKYIPTDDGINKLFEDYKILVNDCLPRIKEIIESYEKLEEPIKDSCSECKEEKKLYFKKDGKHYCSSCFFKSWSGFTLWKEYHTKLEKKFPFFVGNKGYYNGAIPEAVHIVKSFYEKNNEREYEIKRNKEEVLKISGIIANLEHEIEIIKKKIKKSKSLDITKELNEKEKELENQRYKHKRLSKRKLAKITYPVFKGNSVFMGNQNMFKFIPNQEEVYKLLKTEFSENQYLNLREEISEQTSEGYLHRKWELSLTNPYEKRGKWLFELDLGKQNYYQKRFIIDCIEKKQWNVIRARLIKDKQNKHYLVFPARILEDACVKLEKEIKKNKAKDVTFCSLSFSLTKPISMIVFKKGKVVEFKTFGNAYPQWRAEREMNLKSKISRRIHLRHSVLEHFFTVTNKEVPKKDDCFGLEFDQIIDCKDCKIRTSCEREYKILLNEVYPLRPDHIRLNKIRKMLLRERAKFRSRHSNKKKRNAMIKIFQKKMGNRLARFKNTYDHELTSHLVYYVKEKYKNVVFLMRDTKKIKSISYQRYYRKIMKDWSVNQQKVFAKYKGLINGMGNYLVPYNQINVFHCPKCNEKIGVITTMKLNKEKIVKCPKCNFQDNFNYQDCFLIYNATKKMMKI